MRRAFVMTAAFLAAVIFFAAATLPPAPVRVDLTGGDPSLARRTVAGAYHVHTTRSDGAEDKASVAAAAARAGLAFVIFTEHGDGTADADPPAYIHGVLCVDAVEISTNGGHYVALDLPRAPYPLGGEAAAVVEDVQRLGGFGIVAHPHSPKPELAWNDWSVPVDAIEWLNLDSEWRDESALRLARAAVAYLWRPAPAIASVFDRPSRTLQRWDSLLQQRPVVALGAVDAHGGTRRREEEAMPAGLGPSYEAAFRTLSNRVLLERPFSGDATIDARLLLDAIRGGRVYTVVDAIATPALIDPGAAPRTWRVPDASRVDAIEPGEGVARYEVHLPGAPGDPAVPWLVTNPTTFSSARLEALRPIPDAGAGVPIDGNWRIEKDAGSSGELSIDAAGTMTVRYRLAPGDRRNQFVALAVDLRDPVSARTILFEGEASPMRVSVQLRFAGPEDRWVESVYLEPDRRTHAVSIPDMVRAGAGSDPVPDVATARSLLFVVDLTNARPGSGGTFHIASVRLVP